jgi:Zn-dependent protease with chaperone function
LGLQGATPFVVVTSALLDRCTPEETRAVIGHELGHLKCEHSVWLTIAGLAADLPVVGASARGVLQRWRLAAELTCDRAALLVAQDSTIVAGALLKLVAGTGVDRLLSAEAFMQQSLDYEAALEKANPLVKCLFPNLVGVFSSVFYKRDCNCTSLPA